MLYLSTRNTRHSGALVPVFNKLAEAGSQAPSPTAASFVSRLHPTPPRTLRYGVRGHQVVRWQFTPKGIGD